MAHREGRPPPTPLSEPNPTQPKASSGGLPPGDLPVEKKLAYTQGTLHRLIVRHFSRSFRGYDRAAVDSHLDQIVGWLSLSGLDDLLRERFNEQDPLGRELRVQAERDAVQAREDARRVIEAAHQDAERIRAQASQEAETFMVDARADAASQRRGPFARVLSRRSPGV
jgi:DivIVA domain-containing protein